jgi:hypothetical protein
MPLMRGYQQQQAAGIILSTSVVERKKMGTKWYTIL